MVWFSPDCCLSLDRISGIDIDKSGRLISTIDESASLVVSEIETQKSVLQKSFGAGNHLVRLFQTVEFVCKEMEKLINADGILHQPLHSSTWNFAVTISMN